MMHDEESLKMVGADRRQVPNRFFRQQEATGRLAILLPGYAYATDMPLLYYPTSLFLENGFDVLHVNYAYHQDPSFRLPIGTEERRRLFADVSASAECGLAQREYNEVVVLGRSLGTLAMGHLLEKGRLSDDAKWIWMSPLLKDTWLAKQILGHTPLSLIIIGTVDAHYESAVCEEVRQATPGEWLVLEGARHDLEIPGDISRTLKSAEQVVRAIARFSGCAAARGTGDSL